VWRVSEDTIYRSVEGPWTRGFVLRAPLRLRSKSNFRRSRQGADSDWQDSRTFERDLALLVRHHRPAGWDCGDPARPLAERPVVVAFIAARSTIDVANFSKSVLDALEGVLYVSDASVLAVGSVGSRGRDASVTLGFVELPAGAVPVVLTAALAALGGEVTALFDGES
jgi:hypothetical protein